MHNQEEQFQPDYINKNERYCQVFIKGMFDLFE